MQPKRNFLVARLASFGYAFKGIAALIRTQPNAWIHLAATVVVVAAGLLLQVKGADWALLCLAMGMVWTAEGVNTAIENVVDLASPQQHPLAGRAKDVAAGAVLLAALFAVGVAFFVFRPYVLDLLDPSCHLTYPIPHGSPK